MSFLFLHKTRLRVKQICVCAYIYIYIYIYIYLLIYYLPAFTMTKKKIKKPCQNSEITNLESLPGKKRKKLSGEKKEKANFVTPVEKKSRDMQSVGQKNKNPRQNAVMLQLQKVLNTK